MNLAISLVSLLLIFSVSLAVFILYMHAKRRSVPDVGFVELLFLANFFYIFGYAMELASQTITWKMIYNHVQYIGIPFIIPLWLLICVRFCMQDFRWNTLKTTLVFIIPTVTLVLNLTHASNGLLYSSYTVQSWKHLDVIVYQKGIWYFIETIWKTIISAITVGLFARTYRRAEGIRRRQALILLILSSFGFIFSISSLFSATTSPVDFVVLLLSASSVLMFATLFKYSLFDLIPLAYSQLFNGTDYPALVLADSFSVVKANDAAIKIFPKIRDHAGYIPLKSLFIHDEKLISKLMDCEESLFEISVDTSKRYYSAKLTRLNIKQSAIKKDYGYLLVLSDVTSHINLVRDLEIEASTDPLTGILNRRTFFPIAEKTMAQAMADDNSISLIMIDIDHYKQVNDQYGHQAGDIMLKQVSHIICSQTRDNDIVARYGGEEFIILLPSAQPEDAMSIANRICSAVRQHDFIADDRMIHLTVSIGVASTEKSENGCVDNLIFLADKALYDAKQDGRDRVRFRKEK